MIPRYDRSLRSHAELTAQLDEDFEEDLAHAEHVEHGEWEDRSVFQRAQERVVDAIDGFV